MMNTIKMLVCGLVLVCGGGVAWADDVVEIKTPLGTAAVTVQPTTPAPVASTPAPVASTPAVTPTAPDPVAKAKADRAKAAEDEVDAKVAAALAPAPAPVPVRTWGQWSYGVASQTVKVAAYAGAQAGNAALTCDSAVLYPLGYLSDSAWAAACTADAYAGQLEF